MSTKNTVRFGPETWQKGTRGLRRAHATDQAQIINMRLYADQLLGPRPRWRTHVTALPTLFAADTKIWPARYNYGYGLSALDEGFVAMNLGKVEFYRWSDGLKYAERSFVVVGAASVTKNTSLTQITDTLWLVGQFLVELSGPAPSAPKTIDVTNVAVAIDARFGGNITVEGSTVHQGRAFYWGPQLSGTTYSARNRVYYSDSAITTGTAAYGTFTSADQFFDVDGVVRGCASVGPHLYIWTEDGKWTVMQGSGNPGNATFNDMGRGKIPGKGRWVTNIDRAGVFLSSDLMSVVTIADGTINDMELGYLGLQAVAGRYSETPPVGITASSLYNSTLVPSFDTDGHRHNWNGVWTEETWNLTTYGNFQVGVDEIASREMLAIRHIGGTTNWRVHWREITTDEPETSVTSFIDYLETDDSGTIVLPRLFDPTRQVRVKRVIVDGMTWGSSGTFWPAAGVIIQTKDGKATTSTLTLGPATTPLASVPDVARTPIRLVATPSPGPFTSFVDVQLIGIRGMAIEAVTVEFETSEGLVQ